KQAVQSDRGTDTRQAAVGEQAGEVVVAAPRADAAEPLPAVDGGLEDDARVVVESPRQAEVDAEPIVRNARGVEQVEDRAEVGDPLGRPQVTAQLRFGGGEDLPAATSLFGEVENALGLIFGEECVPRRFVLAALELSAHLLAARLGELVERPQDRSRLVG